MLRLEDGELGDERLGKENSLHGAGQEVTVGRDSPCSASGCSHLCIVETPWPGCRRERCSLRRAAVHGVLWLLPDKLPKRLKPSPQLVCPACEDEEISHRGDWCEVKSVAQGIRLRVLPLSPALGCQHWTEPSYFPRESFTVTSFLCRRKLILAVRVQHSSAQHPPQLCSAQAAVPCGSWTWPGACRALGTPPATGSVCALQNEQPRNIQGTHLSCWESGNLSAGGKCCCCGSTGPRAGASPASLFPAYFHKGPSELHMGLMFR